MSVPIGPQRPLYDPTPDAEGYVQLLWGHIVTRILALIHPHHYQHEPGGLDFIEMPLGGLKDVLVYSPTTGDVLTYSASGTTPIWRNLPIGSISGGGGGTVGQAFFEMIGVSVGAVPGPTNLTGNALQITEVLIGANVQCEGAAAGQSFSFGAGGGTDDNTGLTTSWSNGAALSVNVTGIGTASGTVDGYLTVDVLFARGTA